MSEQQQDKPTSPDTAGGAEKSPDLVVEQTTTTQPSDASSNATSGTADHENVEHTVEVETTVHNSGFDGQNSSVAHKSAPVQSKTGAHKSQTGAAKSSTGQASQAKSTTNAHASHKSSTHHQATSATGAATPSPAQPEESKRGLSPTTKSNPQTPRRKRVKLGELDLQTAKIGFLGAGKMTECTVNGLIHYAKISPSRIHVAAPTSKNLERFKALGCHVTKRNYDIFGRYDCDIIFLAFHGYVIKHCQKLGGTRPHPLTTNYIPHQRHPIYILSLVSGIKMKEIRECLLNPDSQDKYIYEMHRIMMNTAVGQGLGICAVDVEPDSKKLSPPIRQLLSSIAHLEHVPTGQMDAACALGGSGLAFAYYFISALADGAFKMGLTRQKAIRFASRTAQCAAQTLLESGKHPAELRDTVSSPSGAAIYGVHVLDKADVASGVTAAVEAAHKRASDLANQDVSS